MDGSIQGETEGPETGPQGVSAFRDAHLGRPEQGLRLGIQRKARPRKGLGQSLQLNLQKNPPCLEVSGKTPLCPFI